MLFFIIIVNCCITRATCVTVFCLALPSVNKLIHIHRSNIVRVRLIERVWCTKFQSSLLNIYFRLSGFQSSLLLIYFRHRPKRCSHFVHTIPKNGTKSIRHMTLHFRDRRVPPQPFLCVNKSPVRYYSCGGANAIWYSVNIAQEYRLP